MDALKREPETADCRDEISDEEKASIERGLEDEAAGKVAENDQVLINYA